MGACCARFVLSSRSSGVAAGSATGPAGPDQHRRPRRQVPRSHGRQDPRDWETLPVPDRPAAAPWRGPGTREARRATARSGRAWHPGGHRRPAAGLPAGAHRARRAAASPPSPQRGARRRRRRQPREAAQGPVLPRLLRHPRRRLRRRLPALPDRPRARADPGLAGRHRRRRQPRPRARRTTAASPRAASASSALVDADPRRGRRGVGGLGIRDFDELEGLVARARHRDRRHRHARRAPRRRSATGWSRPASPAS